MGCSNFYRKPWSPTENGTPHPLLNIASLQMKIQASHLGTGYSKANRKDDEDDADDNKEKEGGKKTELKKRPAATQALTDDNGKDPNGL